MADAKPKQRLVSLPDGADAVLTFWQAGQRSQRRLRERAKLDSRPPNRMVLDAEAVTEHLDSDTLRKARRAAEQYSRSDIKAICQRVKQCNASFGATHLIRLLAIKNRKVRDRLTMKAIESGWSVRELERVVQAHNGPRGYGGKYPTLPDNLRERLTQLLALTVKWERWCVAAADGLPEEVAAVVKKAVASVARVNVVVKDHLVGR